MHVTFVERITASVAFARAGTPKRIVVATSIRNNRKHSVIIVRIKLRANTDQAVRLSLHRLLNTVAFRRVVRIEFCKTILEIKSIV